MWLIALASTLSSVWILIANAWMQHPVGYTIRNGRAELTDFAAVVFQKYAIFEFLHTISAAYIFSAFLVMGISAYHLLKKQHVEIFTKSFRMALIFGMIFSFFEVIEGHFHGSQLAEAQPTKLAAMEAHWETGTNVPLILFAIPDEKQERNIFEFGRIPGMVSLLSFHDVNSEVKGLKDFPPEERPPVLIPFVSFKIMVGLGFLFPLLTLLAWIRRNKLLESPLLLRIMLFSIPLPYISIAMGWALAEIGRQPWIVYGVMKTADAASPIAVSQVATTLFGFIVVYGLLGLVGIFLVAAHVKKGPVDT